MDGEEAHLGWRMPGLPAKVSLVFYRYLEMLLEYLQDYTDRVKPLLDQNELFGKIQGDFEKKWEIGTFPGWPVSAILWWVRLNVNYNCCKSC